MKQLSFGIMCEDATLSAWQASCVQSLLAHGEIKLKLLIKENPVPRSIVSRIAKLNFSRLLYLIYSKIFFRPRCNARVDMAGYYKGVAEINCSVITKGKYSQYFSDADLEVIKSHSLDFVLRFGFNIIRGKILSAAKYGIWSFHHGDPRKYRGGPPCFWELYHHERVVGAMLQQLTEGLDNGVVLKLGFYKTCLYSYQKTISHLYLESAQWPLHLCKQILTGNEFGKKGLVKTEAPISYPPSNLVFIFFLFKILRNKMVALITHLLFRDVWNVGLVAGPVENFLIDRHFPSIDFLPTPKPDEFRADSFGYLFENRKFLLLEHYDFKKSVGRIELWEYLSKGSFAKREEWNDTIMHRSYPYIFTEKDILYCTPESSKEGRISLFKLEQGTWKDQGPILEGKPFVDPTLIQYQNKYWIFYTLANQNSDVNLFISFSDSLYGPWIEHPGNPVKSDITSSRPAGNFFVYKDELYRPAQNCSRTYGGSIAINKVTVLSESDYQEETVREIFPWNREYDQGIHTLAVVGDDVLIDAKKRTWKFF